MMLEQLRVYRRHDKEAKGFKGPINYSKQNISALNASVAHLDSVSPFDSGCNRFKSFQSDCSFDLATAQLRNSLYGVSQLQGVQDIGNRDAQVIDIQLVGTTNKYYEN